MRIRDGVNPLDASAVHPESYPVVDAMARDLGCSVMDLMRNEELRQKINLQRYATETVGLPTLNDIRGELAKPGRDPRKQFEIFKFADGVEKILPLFGYNLEFLWTEVLIDVAYQLPESIDLFARFPVGPGALPTFKNIDPDTEPDMLATRLAATQFDSSLTYNGLPIILSAENWEGVGCEYRKYTNLSAGHGRKRIFAPRT